MHLRLVGVHHELYVPAPRAYGRTRGAEYLRLRRSERESRALIRSLAAQAGPVGPAFSRSAPWHTYALALTLARARQRRDSPLARDSLSLSACARMRVDMCIRPRAVDLREEKRRRPFPFCRASLFRSARAFLRFQTQASRYLAIYSLRI